MPNKTQISLLLTSSAAMAGDALAASLDSTISSYIPVALFTLGAWALLIGLRNLKELKHKRLETRRRR